MLSLRHDLVSFSFPQAPGLTYELRVVASNALGHSPPSEVVRVRLEAEKPVMPFPPSLIPGSVKVSSVEILPGRVPFTGGAVLREWEVEVADGEKTERSKQREGKDGGSSSLPPVRFFPFSTVSVESNLAVTVELRQKEEGTGRRLLKLDDLAHEQSKTIPLSGLKPGRRYWVRCAARNTRGRGPFCPPMTFVTAPTPPLPPSKVEVEVDVGETSSSDRIIVTWSPSSDSMGSTVLGYVLQGRCDGGGKEEEVGWPLASQKHESVPQKIKELVELVEEKKEEEGFVTLYAGVHHSVTIGSLVPGSE